MSASQASTPFTWEATLNTLHKYRTAKHQLTAVLHTTDTSSRRVTSAPAAAAAAGVGVSSAGGVATDYNHLVHVASLYPTSFSRLFQEAASAAASSGSGTRDEMAKYFTLNTF